MQMFVFFGIAVCMVGHAVRGDTDLASQDGNKQHSSTFFMMYKFMDDIFAMKEQMSEFKDTMDDQQEEIRQLKYVNDQLESKVNERRPNMDSGANYVRWGRTDCPTMSGAVKIYAGYAAGDLYTHAGGGVELLCLPKVPTWGKYSDSRISHAFVYGAEIELVDANSIRLFGKKVHNENVPCVVCQSVGRYSVLRIPGNINCHTGWTMEYTGYLFAGSHYHAKSTDYTCIDSDPGFVEGKTGNQNGRLLYPVEANCGSDHGLQCPPYKDGRELACVVCTK